MKPDKYYSTDLRISIVEIVAKNEKQAEAIMQKFIDKIAVVMDTVVRWNESHWEIEEHILDKNKGEWITT
jgi:hypothetical protein